MDEDQVQPESSSSIPQLDFSRIADEPRETVSMFVGCEGGHKDLFTEIQTPPTEDWEMPFTDLEMAVFRHLRVSPSQLHPNSLAFLPAFKVTANYLGIVPTLKLFFHAFGIQRSCPKGEKAKGKAPKGEKDPTKHGWVSFKQRNELFKMFEDSVRGFKAKYFRVRPVTVNGWKSIVYRGPKKDDGGNVVMGPQGIPVEEDYAKFSFRWNKWHFLIEPKEFTYKRTNLS
ncbi:hypothetical protein A2U01_0005225, partial [Trifolium medium]|nr:hypothetical protein [Trifolium medium]